MLTRSAAAEPAPNHGMEPTPFAAADGGDSGASWLGGSVSGWWWGGPGAARGAIEAGLYCSLIFANDLRSSYVRFCIVLWSAVL